MDIDFLFFLLQGTLETMGIMAMSFALAKTPFRWSPIVIISMSIATLIYFVKLMQFAAGLHTILIIIIIGSVMSKLVNLSLSKTFIAVFLSMTMLAVLEIGTHELFFFLTKLDVQEFASNAKLWALLGLPQAIIMIMIAVIVGAYLTIPKNIIKAGG